MVNFTGISKAAVLAALYNASKPQGKGFLHFASEDMTELEAEDLIHQRLHFDYIKGRIVKVILSDDNEFDEYLYDRDNGPGAAQEVINFLRGRCTAK